MVTLDGVAAGNRLLAFRTVKPGTCLNAVWRAFGSPKSDGRYPYSTAMQSLKRARELGAIKGYNINDAPEGSILFWSNVWGNWSAGWSDAGHIAIKGPGNTVTTIDRPVSGVVGRVKPSGIWSHLKFEGYAYGAGAFMGHGVSVATDFRPAPITAPATQVAKAIVTEREPDMRVIKLKDSSRYALIGFAFFQETTDVRQANAWAESWGDRREVTKAGWDEAFNMARVGQQVLKVK